MLTDNEMNKLKAVQLEIMDYIHSVCVANDIKYFLYAGSCIGAVRHNGYIPWDYDIDICMLRSDYEKFEKVLTNTVNPNFTYINYKLDKDYYRPHAIVVKNNTAIYTKFDAINRRMKYNHGIYVDVMPLDFCDGSVHDKKTIRRVSILKKIISLKKGYHYSKDELVLKKCVKGVIRGILSVIPLRALNCLSEHFMKSEVRYGQQYITDYSSKYSHEKSIWPADVFSVAIRHTFEDRQYFITQEYDRYLKVMYGDYMKLPDATKISDQRDVFDSVVF